MEEILGFASRCFIRHAIVGAITGGVGNILMLAGDVVDIMDISDTMDAANAMDAVDAVDAMDATYMDAANSSSAWDTGGSYNSDNHHEVLFGNDGRYPIGKDHNGEPVGQGSLGDPYLINHPDTKVPLSDVTQPPSHPPPDPPPPPDHPPLPDPPPQPDHPPATTT